MDELYGEIKKHGKVRMREPLAKHTTFKIGGPADFFVIVSERDHLVSLVKYLDSQGVGYTMLGGGSNLLVSDEGYQGVVVSVKCNELKVDGGVVIVDAGCTMAGVAQEAGQAGLSGFEWGVGVPGTVGGAVIGNAGVPGSEMKDSVEKVEVYRDGEVLELSNEDCEFGYRDSIFKHNTDIVLRVWLKLGKSDDGKTILEYIEHRNQTQPKGQASSGCTFKNVELSEEEVEEMKGRIPEEFLAKKRIPAGWLVDQARMKGKKVGGAQVSEHHANFIINLGDATCQDVLSLIAEIKEKVYTIYSISLEEEVRII